MSICDSIPKLSKCCCCINLRLGGLIIAALILVFSILNVVSGANMFSTLKEDDENYNSELTSAIITIVIACLDALLSIYLFFGIITNRYHWLLPYLWVRGVLLVVYLILAIFMFFIYWGAAIAVLIGFFISLYFWMCLQSLYQEMKGSN